MSDTAHEVRLLGGNTHQVTTPGVRCSGCGFSALQLDTPRSVFASALHAQGWRAKNTMIAWCPSCAQRFYTAES